MSYRAKNKRGVSVIIGYILLIAIVVAISVLVYQWMKSYIPQNALQCPDGVSASIPDYVYNCSLKELNFTFRNSGTFSVAGYFVKAANNPDQTLATLDLTPYYTGSRKVANGAVLFSNYLSGNNPLDPGSTISFSTNGFNTSTLGTLYRIEVTPVRYVKYNNQIRFTICGNAKISQKVTCS